MFISNIIMLINIELCLLMFNKCLKHTMFFERQGQHIYQILLTWSNSTNEYTTINYWLGTQLTNLLFKGEVRSIVIISRTSIHWEENIESELAN